MLAIADIHSVWASIRVWYRKTYHTRMVRTVRVWYEIRVRYTTPTKQVDSSLSKNQVLIS